jgi:hypothetical protein
MSAILPPDINQSLGPTLSLGADVLHGADKPKVRITIEGQVGCAKSSILLMIHELFKDKVEVVIGDEYTKQEVLMNRDVRNHEEILTMYAPTIVLYEKINPNL